MVGTAYATSNTRFPSATPQWLIPTFFLEVFLAIPRFPRFPAGPTVVACRESFRERGNYYSVVFRRRRTTTNEKTKKETT